MIGRRRLRHRWRFITTLPPSLCVDRHGAVRQARQGKARQRTTNPSRGNVDGGRRQMVVGGGRQTPPPHTGKSSQPFFLLSSPLLSACTPTRTMAATTPTHDPDCSGLASLSSWMMVMLREVGPFCTPLFCHDPTRRSPQRGGVSRSGHTGYH